MNINIKTVVNSKTDLDSRLQAAVFMIRYLKNELNVSKRNSTRKINFLQKALNSASNLLSENEYVDQCYNCNQWFNNENDEIKSCIDCDNHLCNSCLHHGSVLYDGSLVCENCKSKHKLTYCWTCEELYDNKDNHMMLCHYCDDEICYKCINTIKKLDNNICCRDCIEYCDICGKTQDNEVPLPICYHCKYTMCYECVNSAKKIDNNIVCHNCECTVCHECIYYSKKIDHNCIKNLSK